MKLWQLVSREIWHRKLNFFLSLLAVVLAVTCAVGFVTLLDAQEQHTKKHVAALDDEIRKITKQMGFNVYILPAEQNLADFHSQDFAVKTMPQSYVDRLAESRDVVTINHLRPALIRKLKWPEQNRQVVLMGVSGVVPFHHRDRKKPLALPVPKGKMNVGSVLADELALAKGQQVEFLGQKFQVDKIYPPRGNMDDIYVWIDLKEAQNLLNMQDQINLIQALECNCASVDRLAEVQAEISKILGADVQVIEMATKAIARAKARTKVKQSGEVTLKRWQTFAAIVLPINVAAAGLWVALLSLINIRSRRAEIGIWRAIGFRSRRILTLFLSKAVLIGLVGAVAGIGLGASMGHLLWDALVGAESDVRVELTSSKTLWLFSGVLFATPLLAILATWLPALSAANQDPAVVLREE